MAAGDGIKECEKAFERLVEGRPYKKEHIGKPSNEITAGIVSVEAGFDRGYLKKSRNLHRSLIARIEANKNQNVSADIGRREILKRAKARAVAASIEKSDMKARLDKVLTQNLMLVERIRELEGKLGKSQSVIKL